MIRAKVEERVGKVSNETWEDTCTIINKTLTTRNKYKLKNNLQYVLILCIGVASAIDRGLVRGRGA